MHYQLGVLIHPPPCSSIPSTLVPSIDYSNFILFHVMLWDPVLQLSYSNQIYCPETGCGSKLHSKHWKWGQSTGSQPRVLHDVDYTVLLVSVMLTITNHLHCIVVHVQYMYMCDVMQCTGIGTTCTRMSSSCNSTLKCFICVMYFLGKDRGEIGEAYCTNSNIQTINPFTLVKYIQ